MTRMTDQDALFAVILDAMETALNELGFQDHYTHDMIREAAGDAVDSLLARIKVKQTSD